MAKKDRQKRSARKARQQKRAELDAAHAVSGHADAQTDGKGSKVSLLKKSDAKSPKKSKGKDSGKKKSHGGRIRGYFKAVRTEMHQVVWPSRSELRNYSIAVVAMLIVFGVCVWLVDTGFVTALVALAGLRG